MKKEILISIILFLANTSQAQINGFFCHNKDNQLKCASWLNYVLQFENNKFIGFHTSDSSIYYNPSTKTFRVLILNDTLIIQLKDNGVQLFTLQNTNNIFLPVAKGELICDNGDEDNLTKLNRIGNLGILPFIMEQCKLKGLQLPIIKNNSIGIFFFRGVNDVLYWDIIVHGLKGNYEDYNQLKLFSNDYDGEVNSINFCFRNGGNVDYKNIDPGTELGFTPNKSKSVNWKLRRVVATRLKDYVAFVDLIQYNKKGEVKSAKIPVEQCSCE